MDSSENEARSSKRNEAIAPLTTIARTLSTSDLANHGATSAYTNGKAISNDPSHVSETAANPIARDSLSKYRHIAAVHSRARTSCLSRDTEVTPNFLGFRNLMVIVLSMYFLPVCQKLRFFKELLSEWAD